MADSLYRKKLWFRHSYAIKRWTWMNGETLSLWIVSRQEKFFFRKFISLAYLTQKNSLNLTVQLFSKSDKNGDDIGVRWRIEGRRISKSRSAKMPQFTRICRQADRKLVNPPFRYCVWLRGQFLCNSGSNCCQQHLSLEAEVSVIVCARKLGMMNNHICVNTVNHWC